MTSVETNKQPAGLLRRLAASFYDLLLLAGLLMVAGVLVLLFREGEPVTPGTIWFQLLMLACTAAFYIGFWVRGGQTLGMRSWKLRVETRDGQKLNVTQALLRFAAAFISLLPAGLGLLWILIDPDKLAWHDRLSGTRVMRIPKEAERG